MRSFYSVLMAFIFAAAAHAEIKTKTVEYKSGDTILKGYLAYDDAHADRRPGVVVFPEWWGLTDYPRHRAQMLASSITENTPGGVLVYNLTVEDDHTYFVEDGAGSQEFVWVHNGACDGEPRRPIQSSGHTLSNHAKGVLSRRLGVDPNKLGRALEALKADARLSPDYHGKIWSNGDFTSKDGTEYWGNIADYLP